jgi:hypothetical protein
MWRYYKTRKERKGGAQKGQSQKRVKPEKSQKRVRAQKRVNVRKGSKPLLSHLISYQT